MDYSLPYILKGTTKEVGEYWKGIQIPGFNFQKKGFPYIEHM